MPTSLGAWRAPAGLLHTQNWDVFQTGEAVKGEMGRRSASYHLSLQLTSTQRLQ